MNDLGAFWKEWRNLVIASIGGFLVFLACCFMMSAVNEMSDPAVWAPTVLMVLRRIAIVTTATLLALWGLILVNFIGPGDFLCKIEDSGIGSAIFGSVVVAGMFALLLFVQ